MAPPSQALSGPQKAVLFLLSLDKEAAAPIVEKLSDAELRMLRRVAAGMQTVTPQGYNEMFHEFLVQASRRLPVPKGGATHLKQLTARAHGEPTAAAVFGATPDMDPMRQLERAHPEAVASLLDTESPRLAAAVMARLQPAAAQKILKSMPAQSEAEVLTKMATMKELPSEALEEVAKALSAELPAADAEALVQVDGVARAAEVLNAAGRSRAAGALDWMGVTQPDTAQEVRLAMFTFEDVVRIDRRDMRTLLREVSSEQLMVALKGASDAVREAIFNGLSERARRLVLDDLEVMGRLRPSEVVAARKQVIETALRLETDGVIDLGRD